MLEKIRYWWSEDRKWFCIYVDDGNARATISLGVSEAGNLGAEAIAPPTSTEILRFTDRIQRVGKFDDKLFADYKKMVD